jgi:hypothetical protein
VRGTVFWILARLIAKSLMSYANVEGGASGTAVPVWTLLMLPSLMLADLWRRKELALIHNLGITTSGAVIVGSVPALILEVGLLLLVQ